MKVGHIYLDRTSDAGAARFASSVEGLDRLAVSQHVLMANRELGGRFRAMPYVTLGPPVSSPVMAYCLMPGVDIVHIHDERGGQAGLLLTLTRAVPYVITADVLAGTSRNPLRQSVKKRSQAIIDPSQHDPQLLIDAYRRVLDAWSKLPEDAECG